ncbi:chorismate lyase [Fischerella thermalis]|uniref:chorismate lyase n=1 Tax=Fischerella thermalis TaxID=372787 RepID=UPI0019DE5686|nr:chorismate lyase [Fischerella thermalis]MBF1988698.1 chorismate lyase [Fischerella thermalis M58_A2018_009]MBF2061237.1 chorismate lyase [Fischerella thermalis M66_A2018_004]MBF2069082.1 chorismate lyase [Fischerella thermalis M48_A2018_028]
MTATFTPTNNLTLPTGWHRLTPIWQGGEEVIQQGLPHAQLAPAWQLLLLGDGSPTRHLQLLTGEPTEVDVIDMSLVGMDLDGAPDLIKAVPGPRLRRQVWLRTASGQRLAYATSWWEASHVDEYLQNRSLPIWASLARLRTELYRDVQGIYYGYSDALKSGFDEEGPFWGRHYLFWHHGQPLTLIYEVFSPYLTKYLGAMQLLQQSGEQEGEGEANSLESPEASKNQEVFNFNEP